MTNNTPTRSSILYDISRKLQEYLPGQSWVDIQIKSIADLKTKYPGLAATKDLRSLTTMQSLLSELEETGALAIMRWLTPIDAPAKQPIKRSAKPNTSGLVHRKAPDCTVSPVQISIMIEPQQRDFLDGLSGGRGLHVRTALRHYQKIVESGNAYGIDCDRESFD